jgi:hypothetical protein
MIEHVRQLALGWLFLVGCGSSMHREETTPAEENRDVPMPLEKVPAIVRTAAVAALQGATRISIVHTTSGQYEAEGLVDGETQEVVISPSGAIIDIEDIDDIDLTDDDGDQPETPDDPADPSDDAQDS